ncbi:MAG: dNTP triphosphohydrolase [Cyclobacteriaceae bacterium]|nr:dNTP triphosphohydrolase [Cyclobacteriaceae bacterium]
MQWNQLLSAKRFGESSSLPLSQTRSRFEQDFDRIIFSHPFRKLQDKTQVFPMPDDDFVHTRLTHSLEVSSVGRSLGKEVGKQIIERRPELKNDGITYHDFGAIVAAASLAHDVGNPPFGHSGESGISAFFLHSASGRFFEDKVSPEEWEDLIRFEGNAQGFRILNSDLYGGLKLTMSTLAAFTKYPRSSSSLIEPGRKSQKKYGFTQSEAGLFHELAGATGLESLGPNVWLRHPLAFLVEAADDICYHIIDLEDGTRLGLVSFEETRDLLAGVIGDQYNQAKLDKLPDLNEKLGTLRALSIGKLIGECVTCFLDEEPGMLSGKFDKALTEIVPSAPVLNQIIGLSIGKIYRSREVLEREASGFEVIEKVMDGFCQSVYFYCFEQDKSSPRHTSLVRLLPVSLQEILHRPGLTVYGALQVVTDFVSGLTDSSALKLYRTISGYPLH